MATDEEGYPHGATLEAVSNESLFASRVLASVPSGPAFTTLLAAEMRANASEGAQEQVPEVSGPYEYFMLSREGADVPMYCRRLRQGARGTSSGDGEASNPHRAAEDEHEVLLDPNLLLKQHKFVMLAQMRVCPKQRYLAYTVDLTGDESYSCFVVDTQTGEHTPASLPGVVGVAFGNPSDDDDDVAVLYYTVGDERRRSHRVYRHVIGLGGGMPHRHELIYEEPDEQFVVDVMATKDGNIVTINVNSKDTSEVWILDATAPVLAPGEGGVPGRHTSHAGGVLPPPAPRLMAPREAGVRYFVEHNDGHLYMATNAGGAVNYKLARTPVASPGRDSWVDVVVPDAAERGRAGAVGGSMTVLEDLDMFRDTFVLYERLDGTKPRVRVFDLPDPTAPLPARAGGVPVEPRSREVPLPEHAWDVTPGANQDFNAEAVRFSASFTTHVEAVLEMDMSTLRVREFDTRPRRRDGSRHKRRASHYTSWTTWAQADDGARVPVTMVATDVTQARIEAGDGGATPLLVEVYGAYGIRLDASYEPHRRSLMDRGWALAFAHVRGGGELGRDWYEAGRLQHKHNTFTDFVACVRALHERGVSAPRRTAAKGVSAGGLVMGWVANSHPELVAALVLENPFLDVLGAMSDPSLPLTVPEYAEWGDPVGDPGAWEAIAGYCPYTNVSSHAYPPMLVTAGLADIRTPVWHALKYVSRVRARRTNTDGEAPIVLLGDNEGGHFGDGGQSGRLNDMAREYAFLHAMLGLDLR